MQGGNLAPIDQLAYLYSPLACWPHLHQCYPFRTRGHFVVPQCCLLVCTCAQDERPAGLLMAQPNVPVSKTGHITPTNVL
jgi:hypothetical protein